MVILTLKFGAQDTFHKRIAQIKKLRIHLIIILIAGLSPLISAASHADNIQPTLGPPYWVYDDSQVSKSSNSNSSGDCCFYTAQTIEGAASLWFSHVGVAANCAFYTSYATNYPPGSFYWGEVAHLVATAKDHVLGSCAGVYDRDVSASYICPIGYNLFINLCIPDSRFILQIYPDRSLIPTDSRVNSQNQVLTKEIMNLSLQKDGKVAASRQVNLVSDRGLASDLIDPSSITTDANGNGVVSIETRDQSGVSTVIAANAEINTTQPGKISWLPAEYESTFKVTCYITALESDWPATPTVSHILGSDDNKIYRAKFIEDTKLQGSGQTLDGTILHYNRAKHNFTKERCSLTSTGKCAVEGSIAVDNHIIPPNGIVDVTILGNRNVWDKGGNITGYHVDDYMGFHRTQCLNNGIRYSTIQFLQY